LYLFKINDYFMNIRNKNLSAVAYHELKSMILSGNLPIGKPIVERLVSQETGVSRTPIREALGRLEQEGLVRVVPRKGAFPVTLNLEEYLDILTIREVLEGLAARLAVEHVSNAKVRALRGILEEFKDIEGRGPENHEKYALANVRFHSEILQLSHKPKLIQTIKSLYDHLSLVPWRTIELTGRRRRSIKEHYRIVESLDRRDGDLAEHEMRAHIRSLHEDISREAEENPDLFTNQPAEPDDTLSHPQ
jgi:DNA-binding GntR family transcriptional regulator